NVRRVGGASLGVYPCGRNITGTHLDGEATVKYRVRGSRVGSKDWGETPSTQYVSRPAALVAENRWFIDRADCNPVPHVVVGAAAIEASVEGIEQAEVEVVR